MLSQWLVGVMDRAGLLEANKFLAKKKFQEKGFLGSGGIARFRDTLWAAALSTDAVSNLSEEQLVNLAEKHRTKVKSKLAEL